MVLSQKTKTCDLPERTPPPFKNHWNSFPETWPYRHNGTYTKTETMTNKSVVGWSLALCGPALTFARSCAINPNCATNEHHWGKTVVTTTCVRVQVSDGFQPKLISMKLTAELSLVMLLSFVFRNVRLMRNDCLHHCTLRCLLVLFFFNWRSAKLFFFTMTSTNQRHKILNKISNIPQTKIELLQLDDTNFLYETILIYR